MTHRRPLYQAIASALYSSKACERDHERPGHEHLYEWIEKHLERAEELTAEHMPRGSGIDNGTSLDLERSTGERLVFNTAYHHMDDYGGYDGWTEHRVTVTPSLVFGLEIKISGRDRNGIKDYLADCFRDALETMVE